MRIAFICPGYPPSRAEGGISHYTRTLAHHMSRGDDEILVLTDDSYGGSEDDGKVTVKVFSGLWGSKTVKEMTGTIGDQGVDLVSLQYAPTMYTTSFKLAWRRIAARFPSVISFHTLWGGAKVNYLAAFSLLSSRSYVTATNSEITYLLRKYFPSKLKKARAIPIGSNIPPKDSCPEAALNENYTLPPKVPRLTYFGMCYPGKGVEILLEIARCLTTDYGTDYRLMMVGGGGADVPRYRQKLGSLAQHYGVSDKVTWTGRVSEDEVSQLLHCSKIVLLPYEHGVSDRRGSLMAALAHGVPIVTSPPPIPMAHFENGVNMSWPECYEARSFAKLVIRVLDDDNFREQLRKGALQLSKRYQWPDIAASTREWFSEVTDALR